MQPSVQIIGVLVVCTFLLGTAYPLHSQGTVFTYQGRLNSGGTVTSGNFDFVFTAYDSASSSNSIADPVTNANVGVADGLFHTMIDLGANVFTGGERWLEIAVRTNGNGEFTTLSPRQALTATPYAIYAGGANAAGITGTIPASTIGTGTITSNMLAAGAAAANLAASGQAGVPSGGLVLSGCNNDTNLLAAGYAKVGGYVSAPNLWRQRATNPSLVPRQGHAAVWTGSKMIVWGGNCGNTLFNDGGTYDPASDGWSDLATNDAPASREEYTAVWTGTEMIIWGGYFYDGSYHYFNDGARYNPASNTWTALTTNGAPSARYRHTAVWTGAEMVVWGGLSSDASGFSLNILGDGERYNPTSNTWFSVSTSGAPTARCLHTAVWTGSEMIVWGGQTGSGLTTWLNDGARYSPASDTWSPMSSTNRVDHRSRHTAVWTGSEMIVWGGIPSGGGPYLDTGGRYNPASDTWRTTDYSFAPTGRWSHAAIWTGREMVVWGGACANTNPQCNDGGSYDPSSDNWTPVATAPRAPASRVNHTAVWTGSEMIVWGGGDDPGNCFNDTWSCTPPKLLYLYQKP